MACKVDIRDASRPFLEGMAKSLSRTIDAGATHNADGLDLRVLLEQVLEQIPQAPGYEIVHRDRRRP